MEEVESMEPLMLLKNPATNWTKEPTVYQSIRMQKTDLLHVFKENKK